MNSRPWPLTIHEIPQVNPNAWTQPEMAQNFDTVNNLIQNYNKDKNPKRESPKKPQGPKPPPPGSGTNVLPYDGVSPQHDNVPYVITDGVLVHWPSSTCIIGAVAGPVLTLDITNRICYPHRLVLPVWGT